MEDKRIILLSDDQCTPCEEIENALATEIAEGRIQVLKVDSPEALELLQKAGVEKPSIPSAVIQGESGVKICEVYRTGDITLSRCGDQVIALRESIAEPATEDEEQLPAPNKFGPFRNAGL